MAKRASDLFGYAVRATDGDVGKLYDLYLDERNWVARYLAVETGPWLFGRRVLVRPAMTAALLTDERVLPLSASMEKVKEGPEVDVEKPVSQREMAQLDEYWGWPSDLAESRIVQKLPMDEAHVARKQHWSDEQADSPLRSVREILGYRIRSENGEFGRVADLYLTTDDWIIRYLMIDTHAWPDGRPVLVAPPWLEKVNWRDQVLSVGLTQERIKSSPVFDPDEPISREYELALYRHYKREGYWNRTRE